MRYSAIKLRANLYRVLDSVLATGIPVEIERNGKLLKIIAAEPMDRSCISIGRMSGGHDLWGEEPVALYCQPRIRAPIPPFE